ncbi:MAG TPA: triple tyrosine motif-containing protein [Saprospiraceae bacterium]|nr:triple tyrosine motif-containing protein [Saprospiraceae bacterium]
MMNRQYFCTGLFIAVIASCPWTRALAQGVNFGIPPMWSFPKSTYQAGTQNWDAAQDSRGVMYWANNEGLLQYDGTTWTCLPVVNHTVVRSVAIDSAGRIFTGAQSELGYFSPERNGCLTYHSLVGLLPPAQRSFEDVWDIAFFGGDVFFRTNRVVFQYTGSKIITHEQDGELTAMFATSRGLVIQQDFSTLLLFQNGKFEPYLQAPELKSALTGALPWAGDTLLFSSLKNGLFYLSGNRLGRWATQHDALFQEKRIYCSAALPNDQLALGTSLDGLLVLDAKRRLFRHLTKKSGLQNNNILSTFSDRAGNLWLGLDNGIDCVVLDSPFSSLIPDGELQGTGYTAAVFQNRLYLGVSNGVYVAPWQSFYNPEKEPFFQKVRFTDGQVWSLNVLENELLMGHHEGAFQLAGQNTKRLSAEPGAWTFVPLTDQYLLGGAYDGLVLYRKSGQGWVFDQKIAGLNESCRIMVKDADGSVWVSHPYRGLYHIGWSPERKSDLKVRFFNAANGLPSDLNNYVFQIAGRAVVATERGVYRYDQGSESFVPDEDFNRMLGTMYRIKYLREDAKGNVWYVTSKEVGVLLVDDFGLTKAVRKKVFPELAGKLVGGFEFIYPIDEGNVIFGAEHGFIHYDAGAPAGADTVLQIILSKISASGSRDSVLFGGGFFHNGSSGNSPNRGDPPVLEAGLNNLLFSFSATDFKNPAFVQYRVLLIGLERGWSDWSPDTKRNYTNLNPGSYTFQVQARRKDGRESDLASYTFRIRPPWYASTAAWVLYCLGFAGFIFLFFLRQRQKFESEKTQLRVTHQQKEAQHQREVEQSKAALTEIQNEKLEAEIKFKNQELASATMHLVQKGEILLTVQEALHQILEKSTNPAVKKEIQQLLNLLNSDTKLDEDWEQFAFHFDQVHVDFLKRLREQFPQLSANDHKLSAYLRMNLSTKEIAPLMNISVRGVEASRYRLRRKLGLPNDANLTEFMMGV